MLSKIFNVRSLIAILVILFLIGIDQYTKSFLIDFLKTQPGYTIYLNPFLNIAYTWNYGISFGMFSKYQGYSNVIFLITNSIIILYLVAQYIFDEHASKFYLLVISGGIGNLLDRIFRGAVFDFIHVHYLDYHFPVFNVADMLISFGIFLFVVEIIFSKHRFSSN